MFAPTLFPIWHDIADGFACGQSGFAKRAGAAQCAFGRLDAWSPCVSFALTSPIPSPNCRLASSRDRSAFLGRSRSKRDQQHAADHGSVTRSVEKTHCAGRKNALSSGEYQNQIRGSIPCVNPPSSSHSSQHRPSRAAWQPTASAHSAAQQRAQLLQMQPIATWSQARRSAHSQAAIATTQVSATNHGSAGQSARVSHRLTGGVFAARTAQHLRHRGHSSGGVLHFIDQKHETGAQGHFAPGGRD